MALKGYFDIYIFIAEAEATPALQDCVLSFDPHNINWARCYTNGQKWAAYLSGIRNLVRMSKTSLSLDLSAVFQDFGDGVGGSIYQQQLNVIVRYLSEDNSYHYYLDKIKETHEISDIIPAMAAPRSCRPMAVARSCLDSLVVLFKIFYFLFLLLVDYYGGYTVQQIKKHTRCMGAR